MDAILVVNAGSSSVKFQIFGVEREGALRRLIKGQLDGIGTRPRLSAESSDKSSLIDRAYAPGEIADVPAAIATVASWLRETQSFNLLAVGHRVVHGGPRYDQPVVVDQAVVANLEQYVSLAPLHQPNNLAPIRTLMKARPGLLQVACFDTAFPTATAPWRIITPSPSVSMPRVSDATGFTASPTNTSPSVCARSPRLRQGAA
jgi:acetate kinase